MNLSDGTVYLLFAAISLLSAAAAVVLTGYLQRVAFRPSAGAAFNPLRHEEALRAPQPPADMPRIYEFRDGLLVSGDGAGDSFLGSEVDRSRAFTALTEALATLHPELPARMAALASRGEAFFITGFLGQDALSVTGQAAHDRLVITVMPADNGAGRRYLDARYLETVEREAEDLRKALALSAAIQWKETADGRVIWANLAYLDLAEKVAQSDPVPLGWPLPRVFGEQLDPPPPEGSIRRCRVPIPAKETPLWFEVAAAEIGAGVVLYSARAIDRLVKAETSLRDFVQTVSKTFAALPIGLAVFDHRRELVLFNPALVSISMLDPGALSRRPTLRAFLDQLRERRRMPEPRDYLNWRDEIARLEQGAAQGTYHELWTLPGGESLRVTGRPHPDGAIAFMFEDISREISVTRRFRADMDLDRSILDDTAAAFVVFDREGHILRTNAAYRAMWPAASGAKSLIEAARLWQQVFEPSGLWGEIRQFAAHEVDRAAWSERVLARDGRSLQCRVAPLKGGNTIVWFLSADEALDDPIGGWLPQYGPTRVEREAGPAEESVDDEGESVA